VTNPTPTLATIVDAIEEAINDASTLVNSQTYDEITESVPETPMTQVYPESQSDSFSHSHRGRTKVSYIVRIDYFALQRGPSFGETMRFLVSGIDDIEAILRAQYSEEYPFGVTGLLNGRDNYRFSWSRKNFETAQKTYTGARFEVQVSAWRDDS